MPSECSNSIHIRVCCGKLHLVLGPMFAGKSSWLIEKAQELIDSGIEPNSIVMINHSSDKRYAENKICTHDGTKMSCISLDCLSDLFNTDLTKVSYIFIDEGQFFHDLYESVKTLLLKHKKLIYIGGLDGDYKQEPFRESRFLDLIPLSTSVQKLTARCSVCHCPAPFTKRLTVSTEQILVGGTGEYQPVCSNHL